MLLRTLFALMLLATLAETLATGAHALAKALLRREVATALHQGLDSAAANAQRALAAGLAAGGDPSGAPTPPTPSTQCVVTHAGICALSTTTSVAFAPLPSATATPCADDGCIAYLQGNDVFDEGRIGATIAVQVRGANGAPLGARSRRVLFRTFRVAPYAALAGALDDSSAALAGAGTGDDGGSVPLAASAGTLIDVTYRDAVNGKTMPANVWRASGARAAALPEAWSP